MTKDTQSEILKPIGQAFCPISQLPILHRDDWTVEMHDARGSNDKFALIGETILYSCHEGATTPQSTVEMIHLVRHILDDILQIDKPFIWILDIEKLDKIEPSTRDGFVQFILNDSRIQHISIIRPNTFNKLLINLSAPLYRNHFSVSIPGSYTDAIQELKNKYPNLANIHLQNAQATPSQNGKQGAMSNEFPFNGRCPFSNLNIEIDPKWVNVYLEDGYYANFYKIGHNIFLSRPVGHHGKHGIARFLEKQIDFLKTKGLYNQPYAELKDYSQIIGQSKSKGRKEFIKYVQNEIDRGFLKGLFPFGGSFMIKSAYKIAKALYRNDAEITYSNNYEMAISGAVNLLNLKPEDQIEQLTPTSKSDWHHRGKGLECKLRIVRQNILILSGKGTFSKNNLIFLKDIFTNLLSSDMLPKEFHFVLLWNNFNDSHWIQSKSALLLIESVLKNYHRESISVVGMNSAVFGIYQTMQTVRDSNILKVHSLNEAIENILSNSIHGHTEEVPMSHEELHKNLNGLLSLLSDQTSDLDSEKLHVDFHPSFEAVVEASKFLKTDFHEVSEANVSIQSQHEFNEKLNLLREKIWTLSNTSSLNIDDYLQECVNAVGEIFQPQFVTFFRFYANRNKQFYLKCDYEWQRSPQHSVIGSVLDAEDVEILKQNHTSFIFDLDNFFANNPGNLNTLKQVFDASRSKNIFLYYTENENKLSGCYAISFANSGLAQNLVTKSLLHFFRDFEKSNLDFLQLISQQFELQEQAKDYNQGQMHGKVHSRESKSHGVSTRKFKTSNLQNAFDSIAKSVSKDSLHRILEHVLAAIRTVLGKEHLFAAIFDTNTDSIEIRYENHLAEKQNDNVLDPDFITWLIQNGKSLVIGKSEIHIIFQENNFDRLGFQPEIIYAIPILTGNTVIGIIALVVFDEDDSKSSQLQQILELFSVNIGLSYSQKKMLQNFQLSFQQQDGFVQSIRQLALDDPDCLEKSLTNLRIAFDAELIALYEKSMNKDNFVELHSMQFAADEKQNLAQHQLQRIVLEDSLLSLEQHLESKTPIQVNEKSDGMLAFLSQKGIRNMLIIPISVKDVVFGALIVFRFKKSDTWSRSAVSILQSATTVFGHFIQALQKFRAGEFANSSVKNSTSEPEIKIQPPEQIRAEHKNVSNPKHKEQNYHDEITHQRTTQDNATMVPLNDSNMKQSKAINAQENCFEETLLKCSWLKFEDISTFKFHPNIIQKLQSNAEIILALANAFHELTDTGTAKISVTPAFRRENNFSVNITIFTSLNNISADKLIDIKEKSKTNIDTYFERIMLSEDCHHSDINTNLDSENFEINAVFTFDFPTTVFDAQTIGDRNFAGKKVLIVDDNVINRDVIAAQLSLKKLEVDIAENGEIAFEKASKSKYDLIFMDLHMPIINGFDASNKIRNSQNPNQKTPIIAVTADITKPSADEAFAKGVCDMLFKPVKGENLFKMLNFWLGSDELPTVNENKVTESQVSVVDSKDVFNYDDLLEDFGGQELIIKSLLKKFFIQAETEIGKFEELLRTDPEELQKNAHKLKGAALNLTAFSFGAALKKLEICSKNRDSKKYDETVQAVKNAYNQFHSKALKIIG